MDTTNMLVAERLGVTNALKNKIKNGDAMDILDILIAEELGIIEKDDKEKDK